MAFGFRDQSVVVDLPKFKTADPYFVASSARATVRSCERPMELGAVRRCFEPIECHHRVGKIAKKSARGVGDRSRRPAIYANHAAFRIKRRDLFRILAAPRFRVSLRELF